MVCVGTTLTFYIVQADPPIRQFSMRGLPRPPPPPPKMDNWRNKRFISFKTHAKRERAVTWWNPPTKRAQYLTRLPLSPYPRFPANLPPFVLLLAFSLFELVAALSQCLCSESNKMNEKSANTHNRLRYFLTNKIFLLQVMHGYVLKIFIVKCVTITRFFCLCSAFMEKHDFYCSVVP